MAQEVLSALDGSEGQWPNSWQLATKLGVKHDEVVGALKSLEAREYVTLTQNRESRFELTAEGREYAEKGMPERRLLDELVRRGGSAERSELEVAFGPSFKVALQNGLKKLFVISKTAVEVLPEISSAAFPDVEVKTLGELATSQFFDGRFCELSERKELKQLQRRKLFEVKTLNYYQPARGPNFSPKLVVQRADLTAEDLASEAWRDSRQFKPINLGALGKEIVAGGLHPLLKMRSTFRQVLLEMGFEEMRTDSFVESAFWNFDALFQPQQHPARDAQDTFFLRQPAVAEMHGAELKEYFEQVRSVHESGFTIGKEQSLGWQCEWSPAEARKNILRTHTTAVSARYLRQLAEEYTRTGVFRPRKLFSIDRVYRNETLDSTHLAEFHQIEGLIIGKRLGLGHLKAFIRAFYARIGITEMRFKPAYNPYTEPSMEIFCFHPLLGRQVEIGNSGVFRPEMLRTMGWPADVSVIAWGLSLERPAMLHFGCANIRELLGNRVTLRSIREAPVVTF